MGLFGNLFRKSITPEEMKRVNELLTHANECASLVRTTNRADVFFDKFDEFENTLTDLIPYEKYKIFSNMLPSDNLRYIRKNRKSDENAFVQRSYRTAVTKSEKKKDEEAKKAVLKEYFDMMDGYKCRMDQFNIEVLEDLKKMHFPEG